MSAGIHSFYKVKETESVKRASAPGMLPARVGNRSLVELVEAGFARKAAWGAPAPVQRKWLRFKDSHVLRADTVESGLLWYYDEDTGEMWYKIAEPWAVRGLPGIEAWQGNRAEYETWLKRGFEVWEDFDNSLDGNPSGSLGRFGMELEMIPDGRMGLSLDLDALRLSLGQASGTAVDEGDFKGKEIFPVAKGAASMTLDSRTGYDEKGTSATVVPELVFDSFQIDLNDDLEALGRRICEDLGNRSLSQCARKHRVVLDEENSYELEVRMPNARKGEDTTFGDIRNFGVHITVAMPLAALWDRIVYPTQRLGLKVMRGHFDARIHDAFQADQSDDSGLALDSAAKAFIAIFKSLFLSATKDPDKKADPKQKMTVMNRTSFGRMFTLLTGNQQLLVLNFIYQDLLEHSDEGNLVLTKDHPISMRQMYDFLLDLYHGNVASAQDPTYQANHGENAEKLGASHLGDNTEEVGQDAYGGSTAPILEFRGCANFEGRLEQLPDYLRGIQEDMRKILK